MDILSFITTLIDYALLLAPCLKVSLAVDSISQSQTLSDGTTLVSRDGTFELGFFSPGNSNKRYLGIWFKKIPVKTIVWVANRINPINDSNGILTLTNIGNLVLTHNNTPVWNIASSLKQHARQKNPIVGQLLDSGNLVVRKENDPNPDSYLWQSFDYPTDTMLAGMKLGFDRRIGLNRKFTAWKSEDDPAPGDYTSSVVMHEYPDIYMEKGMQVLARLGPWNGLRFSGKPYVKPNPVYDYRFVFNKDEAYYTWTLKNSSVLSILELNQSTYTCHRYVWTNGNWEVYSILPQDYCDSFGLCGAYGYCAMSESPVCQCLKGFKPKSSHKWDAMDWSQGCVRITPLSCKDKYSDGFVKLVGVKVPDTTRTWLDKTISLEECREKCLSNCSCMAFTNSDVRGAGTGCVMWFDDLVDIKQLGDAGGQNLYVRMDASEIAREEAAHGRKKKLTVIVATIVPAISGMLSLGFYRIYRIQRNMIEIVLVGQEHSKVLSSMKIETAHSQIWRRGITLPGLEKQKTKNNNEESDDDLDLPLFNLLTIATATNKFSEKNKIGEGGFGPVYKGRLVDGQEIAVKKLSRSSRQGMSEFKNEVKLIAKLQHRNLVKLIGYCIQGLEKILVYEYMPNNSLDSFIFDLPLDATDSTKGKLLDWLKRFRIICGISRGLLYLHQDSRLRVIHRDLKASNVLLDDKLNPKISDFGMAKICRGDQIEGNTNRVVRTYGYMAPEYAIDRQFSIKSDVFSFGILLLEIISGKRNRGFYRGDCNLNLIGHAWKLWNEGKAIELIDPNIEDSCIVSKALHCIHISLLCVQQYPEDRPSMPSVVSMLGSETELPMPKRPGFFPRKVSIEACSRSNQGESCSTNEITISVLTAR